MKKLVLSVMIVLFLAACAPPSLYYWDDYSETLYDLKSEPSDEHLAEHIETLQAIIANGAHTSRKLRSFLNCLNPWILVTLSNLSTLSSLAPHSTHSTHSTHATNSRGRLLPVAHVRVFALTAGSAILSVGIDVYLASLAGVLVVIFTIPRIDWHIRLQIRTIPSRRVARLAVQRSQSFTA